MYWGWELKRLSWWLTGWPQGKAQGDLCTGLGVLWGGLYKHNGQFGWCAGAQNRPCHGTQGADSFISWPFRSFFTWHQVSCGMNIGYSFYIFSTRYFLSFTSSWSSWVHLWRGRVSYGSAVWDTKGSWLTSLSYTGGRRSPQYCLTGEEEYTSIEYCKKCWTVPLSVSEGVILYAIYSQRKHCYLRIFHALY